MEDSDWENLPDIIVIEIYKYLKDADRLRMSCVCNQWHDMFSSPILWQTRHVHFNVVSSLKDMIFLQRFGHYLRTLILSFSTPTFRTVKRITSHAETFLTALSNFPKLNVTEVILHHLDFETYWHYWMCRHRVISALCRLMRKARHIHTLNAVSSRLSITEGCRLLESLSRGYGGATLNILFADDLFQSTVKPCKHKRFINTMHKFTNLSYIYLNYMALNSEILRIFAKNLQTTLTKITLSVEQDVSDCIITSKDWTSFSRACPITKIIFCIYATGPSYAVIAPMVKGIPVSEIDIVSWATVTSVDNMQQQIPNLIQHLGKTYTTTIGNGLSV